MNQASDFDTDDFDTFLINNDPAKLLPYSKRLVPEESHE